MNYHLKGYIAILLSGVLYGTQGFAVRFAEYNVFGIIFYRSLSASLCIIAVILVSGGASRINLWRHWRIMLVAGLSETSVLVFYTNALILTTLSTAAFLLLTAPIYVVILARFFLKETIKGRTLLSLVVGILGTVVLVSPNAGGSVTGNLMGFLAGVSLAVAIIAWRKIGASSDSLAVAFWTMMIVTVISVFLVPRSVIVPGLNTLPVLAVLGILNTAVPLILFTYGVKQIEAYKAGILALLEPVWATVLGFVLYAETQGIMAIVGIVMILSAVALLTTKR